MKHDQITKAPLKILALIGLIFAPLWLTSPAAFASKLLDHTLAGSEPKGAINLDKSYGGKVILAVNIASACGYTPQLSELEKLYQKYKDKGFVVLGFPSNDFFQERKEDQAIVEFCQLKYGVSFPIFKKSSVKGPDANPFYQELASAAEGQHPKWNFFKYLINQERKLVGVFPSQEKPLNSQLEKQISG